MVVKAVCRSSEVVSTPLSTWSEMVQTAFTTMMEVALDVAVAMENR